MERPTETVYPPIVAIVGPTAVGKSRLALELAPRFRGVIVSADSRQVYRYMDVGTAKPTKWEQAAVEHFMIDVVEPSDTYSAWRFAEEALRVVTGRAAGGRPAFVVGGTGFYVSALLDGLTLAEVRPNPALRERLHVEMEGAGAGVLHQRLAKLDPSSAERIHPNNVPRLIRALEIVEALGGPVPPRRASQPLPALHLGLRMNPVDLDVVVNRRVEDQMQRGLEEETERLLAMGYDPSLPALDGLGYRQMVQLVQGRLTREDAMGAYALATRQYVRRQLTWFRRDERIQWIEVGPSALEEACERVDAYLSTASSLV